MSQVWIVDQFLIIVVKKQNQVSKFVENLNIIDINKVKSTTRKYVLLGKVYKLIRDGFKKTTDDVILKSFYSRRNELLDRKVIVV